MDDIRMPTFRLVQDLATALVNFFYEYLASCWFLYIFLKSGQRFAMLEIKIVLSTLIRRFKFEVSPDAAPLIPSCQITLKSLTGTNLVVYQR
jgi:hypothetical protein